MSQDGVEIVSRLPSITLIADVTMGSNPVMAPVERVRFVCGSRQFRSCAQFQRGGCVQRQFMPSVDQKQYQRVWIRDRRRQWIAEKGPCASCGSKDNLEIDHIDASTKRVRVSELWSRKASVRDRELKKCQVLCKSCHLLKTRKAREPKHGTNNRYTSRLYRCRCDECRAAHRQTNSKYRSP